MSAKAKDLFCGAKLQSLCMVIGYMHLASSILDISYHLLTQAVVTSGFQCDVNIQRLQQLTAFPFLEPLLTIINLGTHGFYPFPHNVKYQYNVYVEFMAVPSVPQCYPGMLHIQIVDVLNLFINIIWLKAVIKYLKAVYKRDSEQMGMFFGLSVVKLVIQICYLGYQPQLYSVDFETYWLLKTLDILIALTILIIVRKFTKTLRANKELEDESPPPYVEYLVGTVELVKKPEANKEEVINVENKHDNVEPKTQNV